MLYVGGERGRVAKHHFLSEFEAYVVVKRRVGITSRKYARDGEDIRGTAHILGAVR